MRAALDHCPVVEHNKHSFSDCGQGDQFYHLSIALISKTTLASPDVFLQTSDIDFCDEVASKKNCTVELSAAAPVSCQPAGSLESYRFFPLSFLAKCFRHLPQFTLTAFS